MLPDAFVSCSYLLIGCGSSIHRLINHSHEHFSKVLPEFVCAAAGIAAIGARCLFNLGYNLLWREYPIDPLLIEADIKSQSNERNIIDSGLSVFGLASLIYSLYHHHNYQTTGVIIISSLSLAEIICMHAELKSRSQTPPDDPSTNHLRYLISVVDGCLTWLWIFSSAIFGWAMENGYARLATVPCIISMLIYRPNGFYHGWSIRNCLMDYMMLAYVILMTEAICQSS
ncbi:uncharacterized protein LOC107036155 [Diachasma alloeum]|uniref:uncharacterized protein LOC107036155 n=1 Tax=Diachasma alloeum TaxID=454923 RepID=UPI0007383E3B|nr:uncharacterized protein LOC107036155 [Diachasma alloeum]